LCSFLSVTTPGPVSVPPSNPLDTTVFLFRPPRTFPLFPVFAFGSFSIFQLSGVSFVMVLTWFGFCREFVQDRGDPFVAVFVTPLGPLFFLLVTFFFFLFSWTGCLPCLFLGSPRGPRWRTFPLPFSPPHMPFGAVSRCTLAYSIRTKFFFFFSSRSSSDCFFAGSSVAAVLGHYSALPPHELFCRFLDGSW